MNPITPASEYGKIVTYRYEKARSQLQTESKEATKWHKITKMPSGCEKVIQVVLYVLLYILSLSFYDRPITPTDLLIQAQVIKNKSNIKEQAFLQDAKAKLKDAVALVVKVQNPEVTKELATELAGAVAAIFRAIAAIADKGAVDEAVEGAVGIVEVLMDAIRKAGVKGKQNLVAKAEEIALAVRVSMAALLGVQGGIEDKLHQLIEKVPKLLQVLEGDAMIEMPEFFRTHLKNHFDAMGSLEIKQEHLKAVAEVANLIAEAADGVAEEGANFNLFAILSKASPAVLGLMIELQVRIGFSSVS